MVRCYYINNFDQLLDRTLVPESRIREFRAVPGTAVCRAASSCSSHQDLTGIRKVPDQQCNLIGGSVQRKMARIKNLYLGVRHVTAIRLRLGELERDVVSSPDHEQPGLLLAHPACHSG